MQRGRTFLIAGLMAGCLSSLAPLRAAQAAPGGPVATPVTPAPAKTPAKPAPETVKLANGNAIIGVVVNESETRLVIFNGAGNLTVRKSDVVSRTPGGELEADTATAGSLVARIVARPAPPPARLIEPAGPPPATGTLTSPTAGVKAAALPEMLRTPELYLSTLAAQVEAAGPGPVLIELESLYRVRPVNRTEAYAQLKALETKADALLKPIAQMTAVELKTELTHSPFSNEEIFDNGNYGRLSAPDQRRLVALKRLVHAFNKETYYTYAVNATFTDLLNPRQPMGDCNSSAALVYHLLWHAGYARSVQLFVDVPEHHAVLAAVCDLDSRAYFGETTGGFITGNPHYRELMAAPGRDPKEDSVTVVASLLNEGYPPGLNALQNLRLALVLRVTSPDPWSRVNFRHFFVAYVNGLLDRHDEAGLSAWSALFNQIEGPGAFEKLPRSQ